MKTELENRMRELSETIYNQYENRSIKDEAKTRLEVLQTFYDAMYGDRYYLELF
jgi:hypothetical protein